MISSMTAYARAEKTDGQIKVSVEIRSYNSRHLDIAARLPHSYMELEEKIRSLVAEKISRGRLEVKLRITDESEDAYLFDVNAPKARAYHEALARLKELLNIDPAISLDLLAATGGIIVPAEIERDMEVYWQAVRDCLNDALGELAAMRKREGDFIGQDMTARLARIETILAHIKNDSVDLPEVYQERLRQRIQALTQGIVEIDPARVAQEAAILADRSDVAEEIVRAESHLEQFRTIMDSEESAGRKLNFLLQELGREFNTMGSKTEKADVSHMIVEVKSELEKIREQVQNVE